MKKFILLALVLGMTASTGNTVNFRPTLLTLSAPAQIQYNFDGKDLVIPVTVTGTPSTTLFCVFTRDQASSISNVRNGFLGWHYVNKIDTSIYISTAKDLATGSNNIIWDGKDENKNAVASGTYTYYLFGFDGKSPKVQAAKILTPLWNLYIQEKGTDGNPLANPVLVRAWDRWTLGNDPEDVTLIQTTGITLPAGYTMNAAWSVCSTAALLPSDHNYFFIECGTPDSGTQNIAKFQWVPAGNAVLEAGFGENGFASFNGNMGWDPGVVTDGNYLYSGNFDQMSSVAATSFVIFDFDGTKIKEIDLSDWWSNPEEQDAGGQMNGGPNNMYERNGHVFLNAHSTCLKQMVNPVAGLESDADFFTWTNGNGDHVLDHNDDPATAKVPWLCNDYNVGPYTYNIYSDANLFSMCPAFDMGAVSFGLMAPDGTGINYFAFAGETAGGKAGNLICDNGSAFDGIYASNNAGDTADTNSNGSWFVAQDSFKGVISKEVGVYESTPAAFTVAQNTPNPFNPTTTINFSLVKAGKVTVDVFNVAGQKVDTLVNASMSAGSHSVVWNASKFSAGVYFYTVKSGDFSKTMKMTLLK